MMTFFKREPIVRWIPISCVLAIISARLTLPIAEVLSVDDLRPSDVLDSGPLGGPLGGASRGRDHPGFAYAMLIVAALQACLIVSARFLPVRVRVRPMERGLPVTARSIVLERWLAVFMGIAVPFLAGSLVWAWRLRDGGDFGVFASVIALGLMSIAVSAMLLFAYRPSVPVLGTLEATLLCVVATAAAIAPAWGAQNPLATAVVLGAVGLALGVVLRTMVPAGSPADNPRVKGAAADGSRGSLSLDSAGVRAFGPTRWTLVRSTLLKPSAILMLIGGAFFVAFSPIRNPIFALYLPIAMVVIPLRLGLNALHGLDPLPMDRTRLLHVAGLTSLAVLVVAMATSELLERPVSNRGVLRQGVAIVKGFERRVGSDGLYEIHVRVPAEQWRLATSADGARVTAPWGETSDPIRHSLFRKAPVAAYCPYDVSPTNSGRFLVWQTWRALQDVHGYAGTEADVHATWFEGLDLHVPILQQHIEDREADEWGVAIPGRPQEAPYSACLAALFAVAIWGVASLVMFRNRSQTAPTFGWRRFMTMDTLFMLGLMAFVIALIILGGVDPAITPIMRARLLAGINAMLGSSLLLWIVLCAGVALGFYALLRWRVRRIEVPALSVNGWTQSAAPIF